MPDLDTAIPAGAPALRQAPRRTVRLPDEDQDGLRDLIRAPEGLTRLRKSQTDKFFVPESVVDRFAEAGWSLEWKLHTLLGQENPSYQVALAENRWEAVTTDEAPGFMPAGYTGAIIRDGLVLMKRPAYLTEEARREDSTAARAVIAAQKERLGQTPAGHLTRDDPRAAPKIRKTVETMPVPED